VLLKVDPLHRALEERRQRRAAKAAGDQRREARAVEVLVAVDPQHPHALAQQRARALHREQLAQEVQRRGHRHHELVPHAVDEPRALRHHRSLLARELPGAQQRRRVAVDVHQRDQHVALPQAARAVEKDQLRHRQRPEQGREAVEARVDPRAVGHPEGQHGDLPPAARAGDPCGEGLGLGG
jgi:hypothetical protein